jgi:D-alanyl-D-alanine carboxypeptidase
MPRDRVSLAALHRSLGVPADYAARRGLPRQAEAKVLVGIGRDVFGRRQRLTPGAARAWRRMRRAAREESIELQVVSAFRSVDYQAEVIRRKLEAGRTIDDILCANAAPGFSEHHTGRALDLTTPGSPALEEEFERTPAFAWLLRHAVRFGFHLSYARDNPWGLVYEPWHWAWSAARGRERSRRRDPS